MNKGKFIVFEGTDGSGKTTQMRLLGEYLGGKGIAYTLTREPTDSPFGNLLRSCLRGQLETNEYTIAAMFAADRLDHISNMKKQLEAGITVLCDRYYFSSLAYNGGLVSYDWVLELNRPAMEQLRPDLVIYLDLSPEESMRRVGGRGERERYENLELQRRIREKYFETFARFQDARVEIVLNEADREDTQLHIRQLVDGIFGE